MKLGARQDMGVQTVSQSLPDEVWPKDEFSPHPLRQLLQRLTDTLRKSVAVTPRAMRQVETLQLGPRRTLYLVECDGQRFLVACGGNTISAPVPLTQRFAAHAFEAKPDAGA